MESRIQTWPMLSPLAMWRPPGKRTAPPGKGKGFCFWLASPDFLAIVFAGCYSGPFLVRGRASRLPYCRIPQFSSEIGTSGKKRDKYLFPTDNSVQLIASLVRQTKAGEKKGIRNYQLDGPRNDE